MRQPDFSSSRGLVDRVPAAKALPSEAARGDRVKPVLWLLPALALLLAHAAWYDLVCDDAYISLRYARNLISSGELVYNIGERVEGFTSPLWVLLLAPLLAAGATAEIAVRLLGGASAALLMFATALLAARVTRSQRAWPALACCWLALSAPVAAWTLAGLETPLFTALITLGLALVLDGQWRQQWRRSAGVGAVFGAAAWTRPEALLLFGCVMLALAPSALGAVRSGKPLGGFATLLGTFVLMVLAYEAFRLLYYQDVLPNTFYVKTTGNRRAAFELGLRYLGFAAGQLGLLAAGLVLPFLPLAKRFKERASPELLQLAGMARVLVPVMLLYVASVGGDFLDLARFLVPLAPLSGCLLVATLALALPLLPERQRAWLALAAIAGLTALHAVHQLRTASRAQAVADPAKALLGLEPLGWSRLKARQWGATGRWLAAHAQSADWMAVGAAGAMPYYAGIRNLDTFGLCDRTVAKHGLVVGVRPGHQRWAPTPYILSKQPAFIFVGDQLTEAAISIPRTRPFGNGYVWLQAIVRADRYGAPRTFFHTFLVRRDRAAELTGSRDVMAPDPA